MEENTKTTSRTDTEIRSEQFAHIKGWGIDANPDDHPNAPMMHYKGDDHNRTNWQRPPLQPLEVEVLKSNEHARYPAVHGTSTPPHGVSGAIRRFAFRYSEGQHRHWLALLLADRVNVVEGVVEDLRKGIVPNIFAEKGWKAEWKYNRKNFVTNIAVTVAVTSLVLVFFSKSKSHKKRGLAKMFGG